MFTSSHTFSTNDVTGTFSGLTQGTVLPGGVPVIDFTATPKLTTEGGELFPINSEFGYIVTDFIGAIQKDFINNPEYQEGWAGNLSGLGGEHLGITVSDAPTDTFKTPAKLGTWLAGIGGSTVKASTEHYVVMQNILSDQRYPGDPEALYPLDDNLVIIGGDYDGQLIADVLPIIGDVNGDGVVDIKDVLQPNETEITGNIAVSDDYSVTLKDDGKLLYRWGNTIKKPNDIRLETKLDLPDEWTEKDANGLIKLFKVTAAELSVDHTITNNPNDQVRIEDLENEAAIGQLPDYDVLPDGTWVSKADYYAGDGTFLPAGTVLRDPALVTAAQSSALAAIGALSSDLTMGFTNAWYTTMNREPFEAELDASGNYISGPRWRLQPDKYGQDLPSIVIPKDPSLPPPPTKDEVKYEVGEDTTTVLNMLDWGLSISRLSFSAGYHNNSGGVTENGLNMTNDLDIAFYVKGDIKPATLYHTDAFISYEEITISGENVSVTGTAGDDYLVGQGGNAFNGGDGADLFVLSYGKGANWTELTSSTVADFVAGEDIISLIDLQVSDLNFDDVVEQTFDAAGLHLSLGGNEIATLTGVTEKLVLEDFILIDRAIGGTITGTSADDYLVGDAGDNLILGLAGNDTLLGMAGDDTLDGGTGADLMIGGDGSDMMMVDNIGDVVVETQGWSGYDTIRSTIDYRLAQDQHIEQLQLQGSAILGAGNDMDNRIAGNLMDNVLDGGRGIDVMLGGAGNDTFITRDLADSVIEAAGRGYDTVKTYVSHKLSDNVERLLLQKTVDDINGIGNSGNNTIVGNNGNNEIQGRDGMDILKGQLGSDTFTFVTAASAANADRIIDFNVNVAAEGDMLKFNSKVYTGLSVGALDAGAFVLGTAAGDADDRFVFDQASGRLWYDADGSGAIAQQLVATFEQSAVVTADDFIIV
jgi:Ca2+-binding RTX toxin-like protein